jgi:hypothetical protein
MVPGFDPQQCKSKTLKNHKKPQRHQLRTPKVDRKLTQIEKFVVVANSASTYCIVPYSDFFPAEVAVDAGSVYLWGLDQAGLAGWRLHWLVPFLPLAIL